MAPSEPPEAPRWACPAVPLDLSAGAIDLWRLRLAEPADSAEAALSFLTPTERRRAERFRFERDRRAYALTRAVLRQLLAAYLSVLEETTMPQAIALEVGEHGKLHLAARHQSQEPTKRLHFNVSHSDRWALLAFARGRQVGVDVEHIRERTHLESIAAHFFAPEEHEALEKLDEEVRLAAFYRCWVRKEAFMKATGDGLSAGLDSFAVSVAPDKPGLRRLDGAAVGDWSFFDVRPEPGYVGAVCTVDGGQAAYLRTMTATVSNSASVQLDL